MTETSDIVEVKPQITMITIEDLKKLTAYVSEVKKALMTEGIDYVIQGKKQYTARSGFAKLAQGFNLSDEILEKVELFKGEEFYGWRFTIRVYNDAHRQATGVGACTVDEPNLIYHKDRPYHDVYSIAYTRAWNRAVSNFVGSSDVSAEEMSIGPDFNDRKKVDAEVNVVDFMKAVTIQTPEWDLRDELNRSEDSWKEAKSITVNWLQTAGIGIDIVEVKSDSVKVSVKPVKQLSPESKGILEALLVEHGFNKTRSGWRLNKKDVDG